MLRKIEKGEKYIEFETEMSYGTEKAYERVRNGVVWTHNVDGSKFADYKKYDKTEDPEAIVLAAGITAWGKTASSPTLDDIVGERDKDYKKMFKEAAKIIIDETFASEVTEKEKK